MSIQKVLLDSKMIGPEQIISDDLRLIAPHVERDAPLGVGWMSGESGQATQNLMGIAPKEIHDHSLKEEQELVQYFIDTDEELVWMIEYRGRVIGAVEIGLKIPKEENGPSISIMIGEVTARGRGIGKKVMNMAMDYLQRSGYKEVNARYLLENSASKAMNAGLGFIKSGEPYVDEDGLKWQNIKKEL